MKFLEWWIFTTGLLCILSADSSIGWCAVLAIFCLFGIIMRQFMEDFEADKRRSRKLRKAFKKGGFYKVDVNRACGDILIEKGTGQLAKESDAWIGHCMSEPVHEENITVWEEWQ